MKYFTLLFTICILIQSCSSTSNFVEAESLGTSNHSYMVGGEFTLTSDKLLEDGTDQNFFPFAVGSLQYGYGLNDRLDLRTSLNSFLTAKVGLKYQFVNMDNFDLATSFNVLGGLREGGAEVVLHTQYKIGKASLLFNPSFSYSSSIIALTASPVQVFDGLVGRSIGLSTGIMFGEKQNYKLMLNALLFPGADEIFPVYGIGFSYDIKTKYSSKKPQ
ncbi:hypothetical protein N9B82_01900 [Saprospiraceae bacterium]|nr:hypothetical protein [Saprospiraceae bacterium]